MYIILTKSCYYPLLSFTASMMFGVSIGRHRGQLQIGNKVLGSWLIKRVKSHDLFTGRTWGEWGLKAPKNWNTTILCRLCYKNGILHLILYIQAWHCKSIKLTSIKLVAFFMFSACNESSILCGNIGIHYCNVFRETHNSVLCVCMRYSITTHAS